MVRRLLITPIIHTEAELGSEGSAHRSSYIARYGDRGWAERESRIDQYWRTVQDTLLNLPIPFEQVKLYQDSLPDAPDIDRLVAEMAQHGSPNHQLLQLLQARGATIIGTESLALLIEEYQAIKQQRATVEFLRRSLAERDSYIARRIANSLKAGEIGILFIGAAHDVARFCDPTIEVAVLASDLSGKKGTPA